MKAFGNQAGLVSIKRTIDFRFILKTHLQPIKFIVGSGGIKDHVPLRKRALNSVFIASRHCGLLEAKVKDVGSTSKGPNSDTNALGGGCRMKSGGRALGLWMAFFDRVYMV